MWAQSPRTKSGSATAELESCRIRRITGLPGSHNFASDFLEAIATAPGADRTSAAGDSADALWGLTADLSSQVSPQEQALYISKSTDGGATWTELARIDSRYFNAKISEGLRNVLHHHDAARRIPDFSADQSSRATGQSAHRPADTRLAVGIERKETRRARARQRSQYDRRRNPSLHRLRLLRS